MPAKEIEPEELWRRCNGRLPNALDLVGPLTPRATGIAAHILIADALKDGLREPDVRAIALYVRSHPLCKLNVNYRQSARMRLSVALSTYLRWFSPPASWELLGTEVAAGSRILDVVWRRDDRLIVADEIKAGRGVPPTAEKVRAQLEGELAAGRALFGEAFRGLRFLPLRAPAFATWFDVDGTSERLSRDPT